MPELPEVETVCRGMAPVLVGHRLARVQVRRPDLRWPIPEDFGQRLTGATVTAVRRRAKYGLIETDRGDTVILHLGMSGRIKLGETGEPLEPHDHVVLETDQARRLVLNDPRRFGSLHLGPTDTIDQHPLLAALGPEPLSEAFDAAALSTALAGKRTPIKAALLDQQIVAGLGNIYVCEALSLARISPKRQAYTVAGTRADRLVPAIKAVLERAIAVGGSSLRDYVQVDGELGYFQHEWRVYGRENQPCRTLKCAGIVVRVVQSNRSTFYCPTCQR
jgi:formamidopyrimidine-DNA glycosylase